MTSRLEISKASTQSQDIKENAHALLAESKKERIKTEEEARALRNRINLLMNEDKKAQRKLEETQKKAKALADIKLENQHHLIEKEEAKLKMLKDTMEQQEKARKLRESINSSQQKARNKLQEAIKKTAEQVRAEKQALKDKHSKLREKEFQKKNEMVTLVKDQQRDGLIHRIQFLEEKMNGSKDLYNEKIKQESEISKKNKAEIAKLASLEGALVSKLKPTQQVLEAKVPNTGHLVDYFPKAAGGLQKHSTEATLRPMSANLQKSPYLQRPSSSKGLTNPKKI